MSIPTPIIEPAPNFDLELIYEASDEDKLNFYTQPEWQAQFGHPSDLISSIVNYDDDASTNKELYVKQDQALVNRDPNSSSSDGSDNDNDFKQLL
jgi:hypothetical protein